MKEGNPEEGVGAPEHRAESDQHDGEAVGVAVHPTQLNEATLPVCSSFVVGRA